MDLLNLVKATIFCGVMAFLCYSYPVLGQAVIIGFLALVWLGYLRSAIVRLRRFQVASATFQPSSQGVRGD